MEPFFQLFNQPLFSTETYDFTLFRIIYMLIAFIVTNVLKKQLRAIIYKRLIVPIDLDDKFSSRLRKYTSVLTYTFILYLLLLFINFSPEDYVSVYHLFKPVIIFKFINIGSFSLNLLLLLQIGLIIFFAKEINIWVYKYLYLKLNQRYGSDEGTIDSMGKILGYFLFSLWTLIGFKILDINVSVILAGSAVLGIGIGFGLQNIASNFVSGILILFEKPIKKGDLIEVDGVLGHVQEISFRSTFIKTRDNITIIVPNSKIIAENVTNWSHNDRITRIHIPIGVAYGSDLELVEDILLTIASHHPSISSEPSPRVLLTDYGDNSINLRLSVWTIFPEQNAYITSEVNFEVNKAFNKHNIEIPFPKRDVYIKSMPNGNTPL